MEHLEQVTFVNWFYETYPEHKLFSIPNGAKRTIYEARKNKLEGMNKGVPDIFVPSLFLFIEMKRTKGGKTSKEQKEWIEYLISLGYEAYVCNGFEEAKKVVISVYSKRFIN